MKYSKEEQKAIQNRIFFCICLFACFIFVVRFLLPDSSFDSLNYHFFLGMKGAQQLFPVLPFTRGEFFPLGIHSFNPLIDTLLFSFSKLVGYRFGTLISLLSLLFVFYGIRAILRCFSIYIDVITILLFISLFFVNEGFAQIASYYIDNIYSAFIVGAVVICFKLIEKIQGCKTVFIQGYAFFIGVLLALSMTKLTNIIYVFPLIFACMYILHFKSKSSALEVLYSYVAFILPFCVFVFPNLYYVYLESGNPVFPYYNGIFHSNYYMQDNWNSDFAPVVIRGANTLFEKIFYPYYVIQNPTRAGFLNGLINDTKIVVLFMFLLIFWGYSLVRKIKYTFNEKLLLFIVLSSYILWQMFFGIARYAITLEMLLACSILMIFCKHEWSKVIRLSFFLVGCILFFQSMYILAFNIKQNTSACQFANKISSWSEWRDELLTIDLMSSETHVSDELNRKLENVDFVLQCVNVTSGYIPTFKALRDKPLLNFDIDWNREMTSNHAYIQERDRRLSEQYDNKSRFKFVAVTYSDQLGNGVNRCVQVLKIKSHISINSVLNVDNFVGNMKHPLKLVFGEYTP